MALGLSSCATKPTAKALDIDYTPQFKDCIATFGERYYAAVEKGVQQPLMRVPPCVPSALGVWSYTVK